MSSAETSEMPLALTSDEKTWAMMCHLSVLPCKFVGYMTFIGPLICWLIKKDSSRFVDYHGREALNFQINILAYAIVGILLTISIIFTCIGIPLLIGLATYNLVLVIIAGIKANNGEMFRYPFIFRLI